MTPDEAAQNANHDAVKQNLEATKKSNNPQPRLEDGVKARVRVKKKFEKGYKPDWSDKLYTVASRAPGNSARLVEQQHAVPIGEDTPASQVGKNTVDPQTQYMLRPQRGLLRATEGLPLP